MWFITLYDYSNKKSFCISIDTNYNNIRQYMEIYALKYMLSLIENEINKSFTADFDKFYNKKEFPIKKHIGDGIIYIEKQGSKCDKLFIKLVTKTYGLFPYFNDYKFDKLLRLQLVHYFSEEEQKQLNNVFINNNFEFEAQFEKVINELINTFDDTNNIES